MTPRERLIEYTAEFFADDIDYAKLMAAARAFKGLLLSLGGEDLDHDEGRSDLPMENGKALGTYWAALCLDDLMRTRQFVRGIDRAIAAQFEARDRVHVLYAGTGPFAALLLPTLLRSAGRPITCTLLEINPLAYRLLGRIVEALDMSDYDLRFENADATAYRIDPSDPPHVIISETMQNALASEQQVPIFLNLMRQSEPATVFVPERIALSIALKAKAPIEQLDRTHFLPVATVLEISKEALAGALPDPATLPTEETFGRTRTTISPEDLVGRDVIALTTELRIYGEEHLLLNQSGLTTPNFIYDVPTPPVSPVTIETQYQVSGQPKLDYRITVG